MSNRNKARRVGGWAVRIGGPVVIVCAVVMFFVTEERVLGFDTLPLSVAVNAGALTVGVNGWMTGQNGWIDQEFYASLKWRFWWRVSWRPPMAVLMAPLWVVVMVAAGATWWSWRGWVSGRAKTDSLLCRSCGYDRTGVSLERPCPECGEAVGTG